MKIDSLARNFVLSLLALAALPAHAAVRLPAIFADHMVIQRGRPVHVWGFAAPQENVAVVFRGTQRTATADALGQWSIELPPGNAGGPFTLSVQGTNAITLRDILVGDVWVASGQSNMGFTLGEEPDAAQELAAANFSQLRLMNVNQHYADFPQDDLPVQMSWSLSGPDSAKDFSAVAFFFGRELVQREHVPIGIIESAWGGTPAEAWTSMSALSRDASLMPVFSAWAAMQDRESETVLAEEKERKDLQARAGTDENLRLPWHPVFGSWAPAALFNGMIAPLTHFPICGVIWYQGESNTDALRYAVYARLFQTLIRDWRAAWSEGDFPFLYVQIANFRTGPLAYWPEVREAQRQALELVNTAMAVTIDIGNPDNIHPTDKQDVGHRLALAARAIAYGEPIEFSGPRFRSLSREGSQVRLYFDHAQGGLVAKGKDPTGFEIAGEDGHFVPASASIDGATVVLSNPGVPAPAQARYGWADNPACNLFNRAGLPASPFSTPRP